ncbi:MAG: hypothetical protein Fur0044_02840 [Anaerolineae bacterium]
MGVEVEVWVGAGVALGSGVEVDVTAGDVAEVKVNVGAGVEVRVTVNVETEVVETGLSLVAVWPAVAVKFCPFADEAQPMLKLINKPTNSCEKCFIII